MSTATMSPTPTKTPKERMLDVYDDEHNRTMRVVRAYPKDQAELRPHPKCRTARELVWTFVLEQGAMQTVMTTGFDFSKPLEFPPAPETFDGALAVFEEGYQKTRGLLEGLSDDDLDRGVQFFSGPGTVVEMPLQQVLWTMLHDQIHHRGQFTVYLRMADGRVPSVYGPSLDEPWM